MFGADLSSVGTQVVVGAILCGDLVLELLVVVEGEDGGDVEEDGWDDDICVGGEITDIVGIELDIVDGIFNEIEGLGVGEIGFPVAGDHSFVSRE